MLRFPPSNRDPDRRRSHQVARLGRTKEIFMFRKLLALEVAALAHEDNHRPEQNESDLLSSLREIFTPRTGNYGSMWSRRSGS